MDAIILGVVISSYVFYVKDSGDKEEQLKKIIQLHEESLQKISALQEQINKSNQPIKTTPTSPVPIAPLSSQASSTSYTQPTSFTNTQTRLFSTFARNARRLL
jgi:hypothetical protein